MVFERFVKMIVGILGKLMNEGYRIDVGSASACGCGKTTTLVHFLYEEFNNDQENGIDRKIVTNFHTRFLGGQFGAPSWTEYKSAQEIFNMWMAVDEESPYYGAIIGITELQSLFNSKNRDNKVIAYVEKCLAQRRKNGWHLIYDSQDFGSADKNWRDKTDYIYRPVKFHCKWSPEYKEYLPTSQCPLDICDEKHQISVFIEKSVEPLTPRDLATPVLHINAWEIGQLFNTREKMDDVLKFNPAWGR